MDLLFNNLVIFHSFFYFSFFYFIFLLSLSLSLFSSLSEKGAVIRAIANSNPAAEAFGGTQFDEAAVDGWVEFAFLELAAHQPSLPPLVMVESALQRLNSVLGEKTFLVGDKTSIGDIVVASALSRYVEKPNKDAYPNLYRWFETVSHQDCFTGNAPVASGGGGASSSLSAAAGKLEIDPNADELAPVALLKSCGIESTTYTHPLVLTVEAQAAAVVGVEGVLTKNLLLRDKKHGTFLVTTWEKRNTRDTKKLAEVNSSYINLKTKPYVCAYVCDIWYGGVMINNLVRVLDVVDVGSIPFLFLIL